MLVDFELHYHFLEALEDLRKKYGEKFAELNGFGREQLNLTSFIDKFAEDNVVADVSIDGNANVGTRDICSLRSEMNKPHEKLLAFNKIFYELEKKHGLQMAKKWLEEEWNGCFYMHDANTSSLLPYCYAYDLEKLATEGLFFIDSFNNQPPKHLTTFTDFVGEFVSYTSNRCSGAVGLPSFLIYSFYFWKKDCENGDYPKSPEYYARNEMQRMIYKLNQPYLRVNQSAFTNVSIFDHPYLMSLFGSKQFPDGSDIIDYADEIIEYQKMFMEVCSEIRSQNMMTFPVLTYCLLFQDDAFVDEDFAKWCCKHNMKWGDSNFFVSEDVTSLSNCCRLVSDIKNLGYMNSIGNVALEVGSIKVNTINLARIAYESNGDKYEYLRILKDRVNTCMIALDIQRNIIKRNIEKGLLPNYRDGLVNMASQYSTIGIVAYYEALKFMGEVEVDDFGNHRYSDVGLEFMEEVLYTINSLKDAFTAKKDYSMNVEAVPAERCAAVLMQKDRYLYPNGVYDLPLYGNQWMPLGVKTTLSEKISLSAILDKACNGGSIAHINIDKPFEDFDMAWKLLNHIAQEGVPYFAFNLRISACENNHGFYGETCPHCGKPKVTSYQRIVGFLVPESTYSKERKEEFNMRYWLSKGELF